MTVVRGLCAPGSGHPLRRAVRRAAPSLGVAARAALAGLVASCAVGPDFVRPPAPEVKGYTAEPLEPQTASADVTGGQAQRFVQDLDIPGQWWTLFHSPSLNNLLEQALKYNSDLRAAQAALRVALENVYAEEGAFFPTVAANFQPSRNKTSFALSPATGNGSLTYGLYTAQLAVVYSPDVWGGTRRAVESLQAQAELSRFQLEATYLTLTSNLVATVVQEASLRAQIAATEEIIKIDGELLALLRRQYELGQVAMLDVAAQESALAAAQAMLPPLQKQLYVQRDLLTALLGRLPSEEPTERFELASLELPLDIPISLPSKLVEQRPDIQQAQANLQAASAQIGVAIANRLPNITLSATAGSAALSIGQLFASGNGFWSLAGSVTQPLFDGFTLLHRERGARAAFDQMAAQYRGAVVSAFQNVADALKALKADADALKAQDAAMRAAKVTLDISRRQLELGQINYLALLNAENTYEQALINLSVAQANRYADTAALFQALGGGWWNRQDVAPPQSATAAGVADDVTPRTASAP